MEKREHVIMASLFVAVTLIFLISLFDNSVTGNAVLDSEELELMNCKEADNWRVCDVNYPNREIAKEAYKEEINS